MKKLGELMMILDLHRQGVKIAVIARQAGVDRKTVRKDIARGVEVPTYGPRQPRERRRAPRDDHRRAERVWIALGHMDIHPICSHSVG